MRINIIVAMALNGVIGNQGKIPWAGKLPADMEHFIEITTGHWVIMGRKTWESIPKQFRPLANRKNVVLTGVSSGWKPNGFCEPTLSAEEIFYRHKEAVPYVMLAHDLNDVLADIAEADPCAEVFFIGGAEVYAQALPLAERIFCTVIKGEFAGDTVFPEHNRSEWEMIDEEPHTAEGKNKVNYAFQVYVRKAGENTQIVDPNNARNSKYRDQLLKIQKSGQCPFCPGGETFQDPDEQKQFVHENYFLWVKLNAHPIKGAKLHFVIIFKKHHMWADELDPEESGALMEALNWIREHYHTDGGVIYMREGSTQRTGATVVHVHAQYIVPEDGEVVQVWFGGVHPDGAK